MTTLDLEHVEWVRALDVPAGAVIAVKANRRLTVEQAQMVRESVEAVLPGRPVLVLSEGFDIIVVRDEEDTNGTPT
jgi:hypothetical protein